MMKRLPTLLASVLVLMAIAARPAQAASIAYTIDNLVGDPLGNPSFTLGFQFTANVDMTVVSLGLFDDSQDGLAERHDIGLWDSGGTLLGSVIVPSGTSGTLVNQFRYTDAAINLTAGQNYFIGALYSSGADHLLFSTGGAAAVANFATDPAITFVDSRFAPGGTLLMPSSTASASPGYFGPNFQFEAAAVPEPVTGLLLLTGAGVWYGRRRVAR